jgi:hypothetical protein
MWLAGEHLGMQLLGDRPVVGAQASDAVMGSVL